MAKRRRKEVRASEYSFLLQAGEGAEQGEACGIDTATGGVRTMGDNATTLFLGFFTETLAAADNDGATLVPVSFPQEISMEWFANDSAPNAVDATDVGTVVYAKDGRTVSTLATARGAMGRVMAYDAVLNRVLVRVTPA